MDGKCSFWVSAHFWDWDVLLANVLILGANSASTQHYHAELSYAEAYSVIAWVRFATCSNNAQSSAAVAVADMHCWAHELVDNNGLLLMQWPSTGLPRLINGSLPLVHMRPG